MTGPSNTWSVRRFSAHLYPTHAQRHIPTVGLFSVTYRCNLRCIHCYSLCRVGRDRELTTEEVKGILDQIANAGCLFLYLTGGEVLCRRDFPEIYAYAKRLGFVVTIYTNATLVTRELIDLLVEEPPLDIEVSLYGATAETYERVTGIAGSFARCRRAIETMFEAGLPVMLKSPLIMENLCDTEALREFAAGLNKKFDLDSVIFPDLSHSPKPLNFRLSAEQIVALESQDPEHYPRLKAIWEKEGRQPDTRVFRCNAGRTAFAIDPYGILMTCVILPEPSYDLRQGPFKEGWQKLVETASSYHYDLENPCCTCDKQVICGRCPAQSFLEYRDYQRPNEFLCNLAHLRAQKIAELDRKPDPG